MRACSLGAPIDVVRKRVAGELPPPGGAVHQTGASPIFEAASVARTLPLWSAVTVRGRNRTGDSKALEAPSQSDFLTVAP
jgi:hypothetical protein